MAVGRRPNTDGLGLAELELKLSRNGGVAVDPMGGTRARHPRDRRRGGSHDADTCGDCGWPALHRRDPGQVPAAPG